MSVIGAGIDPWRVTVAAFPRDGSLEEQLAYLLNYAVLAPSSHNSQPWRFTIDGPVVRFWKDVERALPVIDPHDREMSISLGSALFNYRLALTKFGLAHRIEIPETGNPAATVTIVEGRPEEFDFDLFSEIPKRRTVRHPFEQGKVDQNVVEDLIHAAVMEGAWVGVVQDEASKILLANAVAEGNRMLYANPEFRRELSDWMRRSGGDSKDGLTASGLGMPGADWATGIVAATVRAVNLGGARANRDQELTEMSPALVVIGTIGDDQDDWVKAGQALQRILLNLTRHGLVASPMNQPIEVPSLRPVVASTIDQSTYPQMLLRVGKCSKEIPAQPRRPVSEVLTLSPGLDPTSGN